MSIPYEECITRHKSFLIKLIGQLYNVYPIALPKSQLCRVIVAMSKENATLIKLFWRQEYGNNLLRMGSYDPNKLNEMYNKLRIRERQTADVVQSDMARMRRMLEPALEETQRQLAELREMIPSAFKYNLQNEIQTKFDDEMKRYIQEQVAPLLEKQNKADSEYFAMNNALNDLRRLAKQGADAVNANTSSVNNLRNELETIKQKLANPSEPVNRVREDADILARQLESQNDYLNTLGVDSDQLQDTNDRLSSHIRDAIRQQDPRDFSDMMHDPSLDDMINQKGYAEQGVAPQLRDPQRSEAMNALMQRIDEEYSAKIQSLERELQRKENFIDSMRKELESTHADFQRERVEQNMQLAQINKILDDLRDQRAATDSRNENTSIKLEQCMSNLSACKREKEQLEQRISEIEIKGAATDAAEYRQLQQELARCTEEMEELRREVNVLREQVSPAEAAMRDLEEAKRNLYTLESQLAQLEETKSENLRLKSQVEQLTDEVQNQLAQAGDRMDTHLCDQKIEDLKRAYEDKIATLTEQQRETADRLVPALKQLETCEARADAALEAQNSLQQRLAELTDELSNVRVEMGEQEKQCLSRLEEAVQAAKDECAAASAQADEEFSRGEEVFISACEKERSETGPRIEKLRSFRELFEARLATILSTSVDESKLNALVREDRRKRLSHFKQVRADFTKFMYDTESIDVQSLDCNTLLALTKKSNAMWMDWVDVSDMVENMRGVGRVYIRIKPAVGAKITNRVLAQKCKGETSVCVYEYNESLKSQRGPYDRIFGPTETTQELYSQVESLIDNLERGYNLLMMTYGQTGSGKTYTLLGGQANQLGILGLVIDHLRRDREKYQDINVRMFQLYMNKVYNIIEGPKSPKLDDNYASFKLGKEIHHSSMDSGLKKKELDWSGFLSKGSVSVTGYDLSQYLYARRFQRSTKYNDDSSRSHGFIVLELKANKKPVKLVFCDLGGNEKVRGFEGFSAHNMPQVAKEGTYIVQSLNELGRNILPNFSKGKEVPLGSGSGNSFIHVLDHFLMFTKKRQGQAAAINKVVLFMHVHGYYFQDDEDRPASMYTAATEDTLEFAYLMIYGKPSTTVVKRRKSI